MTSRTSTRTLDSLRPALAAWLRARLGDAAGDLELLGAPEGAGRSSETVLFDAGGQRFVLRLPPPDDAFPLFPRYELARQARVMELVRERTDVPAPTVRWFEADPSILGAPFLVMERIDGTPVPDAPPYVFGSWLTESSPEQQLHVEAQLVEVLVGLHAAPLTDADGAWLDTNAPGDSSLRRHVQGQRRYYEWIAAQAGTRFEVIEELFGWLEDRWPEDEGPAVLLWGDARPANVLFRDFTAVAVLDWEAATIGPPELDLAWLLFFHDYFQRVATRYGHVGLPALFDHDRVVRAYEAGTGTPVRSLDWHLVYAELRQALTSIRVSSRAAHFGERPRPDDPQDLIIDREHLEGMLHP